MNKPSSALYDPHCSFNAAFNDVYKGFRSIREAAATAFPAFCESGAGFVMVLVGMEGVGKVSKAEFERLRAAGSMSGML